jgi:hypothetical protein
MRPQAWHKLFSVDSSPKFDGCIRLAFFSFLIERVLRGESRGRVRTAFRWSRFSRALSFHGRIASGRAFRRAVLTCQLIFAPLTIGELLLQITACNSNRAATACARGCHQSSAFMPLERGAELTVPQAGYDIKRCLFVVGMAGAAVAFSTRPAVGRRP